MDDFAHHILITAARLFLTQHKCLIHDPDNIIHGTFFILQNGTVLIRCLDLIFLQSQPL